MESLARVGVVVEVGAIEVGKPVCIGGKMGRNPVQNHGDAVLVQVVHQIHEILRRSVARSRGEVTGRLISPGTIERMFHHWQKFDVGETQLPDVFGEARRGFTIVERTIMVFRDTHP